MNQGQMDHMQLEAMAEQAKNRQAKDAMVRDKSTGEAGVSPKLLFKALMPNGRQCRIFADGSTEGFPENAIIHNYFKPLIDFERGLQKQSEQVDVDQCLTRYLANRQEIYPHLQNITVESLKGAVARTEYTVPKIKPFTVRCVLHVSNLGDDVGIRGEYSFMSQADFEYHTGCELAYLSAMFALIKYESFHLARVAEEKAKWLAGVEQDARSTFGSVSVDCTDRATGQCVAASVTVQPHQQRVIDEKAALDKNVKALSFFISVDPVFEKLDPAEQERMKVQNDLMWQLSEVLGQRIAAFGGSLCNSVPTDNRPSQDMSFGQAIEALKRGERVARAGWNGKGMWLMLVPANLADAVAFQYAALDALPWIGMKTDDEKFVPWLASQAEMLAEDWFIIDQLEFRTSTKDSGC